MRAEARPRPAGSCARRRLRAGARAHASRGQRRLERARRRDELARRATAAAVALDPEAPPPGARGRRHAAVARPTPSPSRPRGNRRIAEAERGVDAAAARVRDTRGRLLPGDDRARAATRGTPIRAAQRRRPAGRATRASASRIRASSSASSSRDALNGDHRSSRSTSPARSGRRSPPRRPATAASARAPGPPRLRRRSSSSGPTSTCSRRSGCAPSSSRTSRSTATQLANAQQRYDAGRLTRNELLVVQVALQDREQELRQRDLDIDRARRGLNEAIGRPVDAPTARRRRRRSSRRCRRSTTRCATPSRTTRCSLSLVEEQQRLEDTATALARSRLPALRGRRHRRLDQREDPPAAGHRLGLRRLLVGPRHRRPARGAARRGAHPGRPQSPGDRARAARAGERGARHARRRRRAARRARHRARRRRAGRGEPAHPPAAVRRRPRHQRGRARRPGAADAAARDARHRALPGPHPPRRAAGADGPAAGRRSRPSRGSRTWPSAFRSSSPCSPRSARRVWWLPHRPRAGPLHRLRRGRGARDPQRGERAACSRCPFREGDQVPAGAIVARLDDRDIAAKVAPRSAPRSDVDRRRDPPPGGAGRAHRAPPGGATAAPARPRCGEAAAARRARGAHVRPRAGAGPDGREHRAAARRHARRARPGARARSQRTREMLGRAQAEERSITLARQQRDVLQQQREQAAAQLAELEVTRRQVRHPRARGRPPSCRRSSSGRASWRRPARAIVSVLDPTDKYVQVYVPVADADRFRVGRKVRDRARQRARPPRAGRGELRRRHRQLHAREDRDAQRPAGAGLPRQGPHPGGRRALPARHRGQRVPGRRGHGAARERARSSGCAGCARPTAAARRSPGIDLDADATGRSSASSAPTAPGKSTLLRALVGLLEVEADEALVLGHDLRGDVTRAEGAHRLRAAGLQPASRPHRRREPRASRRACIGSRRPRRRRASAELLDRTALDAVRGPGRRRALGRHEAEARGRERAPAASRAARPRRAHGRRRRRRAGGDLEPPRARRAEHALVVLSTSYLDEAAHCDRLVYLDEGRVVATGTPAELRSPRPARPLSRLGRRRARHRGRGARAALRRGRARHGSARAGRGAPRASPGSDAGAARPVRRCRGGVRFAEHAAGRHGDDAARRWPERPRERARSSGRPGSPSASATSPPSTTSSIAVEPGAIFAFLGGNGSGKSTTIRMLIGLLEPTAGQIEVDGIDVIRRPRRVRDRIGYMGQKVSLYQGLSLRENVEFYAGLFGLDGASAGDALGRAARALRASRDAEGERPENLPAAHPPARGAGAQHAARAARALPGRADRRRRRAQPRDCFWEAIQDEAARGVTVFVTTHFLEEVGLLRLGVVHRRRAARRRRDAGRAAPALLRRLSGSTIDGAAGGAQRGARARWATSPRPRRSAETGPSASPSRRSTPPSLDRLGGRCGSVPGAPSASPRRPMTEVFRRVLAGSAAGMSARRLWTLVRREVRATFRDPFTVSILIAVPARRAAGVQLRRSPPRCTTCRWPCSTPTSSPESRRLVADIGASGWFVPRASRHAGRDRPRAARRRRSSAGAGHPARLLARRCARAHAAGGAAPLRRRRDRARRQRGRRAAAALVAASGARLVREQPAAAGGVGVATGVLFNPTPRRHALHGGRRRSASCSRSSPRSSRR